MLIAKKVKDRAWLVLREQGAMIEEAVDDDGDGDGDEKDVHEEKVENDPPHGVVPVVEIGNGDEKISGRRALVK